PSHRLAHPDAAHRESRADAIDAVFTPNAGDGDRNNTLAYVVRAVTPGTYAQPAATVEDMYRPQYPARPATGVMEVKAE
ncbi:hypothetical protein, partial [Mesorhizobium sp. GbtcB19]|uniref:alpha-2-macroglobulin family protein n=1 Tax=Mesorhizobium sp. GbtcB19 TaxID=2824764 RepID=UPI001C307BD3